MTVIQAQNISKAYQLGEIGTGTISRDIERWWAKFRGKEDPFLRIGEINDRTSKGDSDIVWSLKDINFEIQQGDAVGIIGRNGAGKSTLLKLLSRITSPTYGNIKVKGRIASLLEVGTGFHPELTGRENIFLNGAILGMRKREIVRKFDEIVNFAGIERYIDTPVKRYSSGMYVRLAFAVAAYLESEILVVDEVLAVGDAEFQKKCLGKMGDISRGEGRTVLFVSHNMTAISNLCNNGIYLNNGMIDYYGNIAETVSKYLKVNLNADNAYTDLKEIMDRKGNGNIRLTSIKLKNAQDEYTNSIGISEHFQFEVEYNSVLNESAYLRIIIGIYNDFEDPIARFDSYIVNKEAIQITQKQGKLICVVKGLNIMPGTYFMNIALYGNDTLEDYLQSKCSFEITDNDFFKTGKNFSADLTKVLVEHIWIQQE